MVEGKTKTKLCYVCGTTEELSRRGKTNYMCRACRRAEYHRRTHGTDTLADILNKYRGNDG